MEQEAKFLIDNGLYKQDQLETVKGLLEGHRFHNTLIVFKDWKGIYAICRWNMDTPEIAHIIDVAVRKDYRYLKVLHDLIKHGRDLFKHAVYLRFKRGFKRKKDMRLISIKRFLKEK